MQISKLFENSSSLGVVISTMGCASCFPAAATIGTTIGLGALSAYEGLFINTLLPLFATLSLLLQLYSAWNYRSVVHAIIGASGPLMILATLYLFWFDDWSTDMLYIGIVIMMAVSIWQWIIPICQTRPSQESQ